MVLISKMIASLGQYWPYLVGLVGIVTAFFYGTAHQKSKEIAKQLKDSSRRWDATTKAYDEVKEQSRKIEKTLNTPRSSIRDGELSRLFSTDPYKDK